MTVPGSRSPRLPGLILLVVLPFSIIFTGSASSPLAGDQSVNQGHFDGPAELPRIYVRSTLADTPTPGHVRLVKEGDNLQDAIDRADCGDTLKLEAGATFRGLFRLPAKTCDDSHWIVLRTSAPDGSLPPEGARITPCYAGVAALPGELGHRRGHGHVPDVQLDPLGGQQAVGQHLGLDALDQVAGRPARLGVVALDRRAQGPQGRLADALQLLPRLRPDREFRTA